MSTTSETCEFNTRALVPAVAVGGLTALLFRRRLGLIAGLAAGWLTYRSIESGRMQQERIAAREESIDEAVDESFPASDPPSFSGATA